MNTRCVWAIAEHASLAVTVHIASSKHTHTHIRGDAVLQHVQTVQRTYNRSSRWLNKSRLYVFLACAQPQRPPPGCSDRLEFDIANCRLSAIIHIPIIHPTLLLYFFRDITTYRNHYTGEAAGAAAAATAEKNTT